jgi:hypothetical protein
MMIVDKCADCALQFSQWLAVVGEQLNDGVQIDADIFEGMD